MNSRTPDSVPLRSVRLLDQVRERARYLHFSLATEKAYIYWIRFFVRWSGMKHPRDMGAGEVEAFLTMLATERRVSTSTHNQALSALLFLYREVLGLDLPWLTQVSRPTRAKRLPSVLTRGEVASLLGALSGEAGLVAHLLYGTGMRLMEALRLRIKDVDFERHAIIIREAKGNKDRVVMLPRALVEPLRLQLRTARALWDSDRAAQVPGVEVPHALERKYPQVGMSWGSVDPRSAIKRRHHLHEERLQRMLKKATASCGIFKHVSAHTLRLTRCRRPPARLSRPMPDHASSPTPHNYPSTSAKTA